MLLNASMIKPPQNNLNKGLNFNKIKGNSKLKNQGEKENIKMAYIAAARVEERGVLLELAPETKKIIVERAVMDRRRLHRPPPLLLSPRHPSFLPRRSPRRSKEVESEREKEASCCVGPTHEFSNCLLIYYYYYYMNAEIYIYIYIGIFLERRREESGPLKRS